jgi:hypothetical protein
MLLADANGSEPSLYSRGLLFVPLFLGFEGAEADWSCEEIY